MKHDAIVTIGQASERSGVPPKTIRFYEELGLLKPAERLANRYRAYDEGNVQTLRFIRRARNLGFTLEQVDELLALYRNRRRKSEDVKRLALASRPQARRTHAHPRHDRGACRALSWGRASRVPDPGGSRCAEIVAGSRHE